MTDPAHLPPDWDWVTARHACTLAAWFERLYAGALQNVATRKALREEQGDRGPIACVPTGPGLFSVSRVVTPGWAPVAVRFQITPQHLEVRGFGVAVEFDGTLTLTDAGDCRLLVNGEALEVWQVLRRALERLFFGF